MATYTADQVADTLIALARSSDIEITNLKLQKLLYYAQAWSLVFRGEPLFMEEFEAWVHGPVVPTLFRRFKHLRWAPIDEEVHPLNDAELNVFLGSVLTAYGKSTAGELERLSHSESPWKDARGDLAPDVSSRNEISKESMREFYVGLLNAPSQ
jgi:uncharacterized phage-associated protein